MASVTPVQDSRKQQHQGLRSHHSATNVGCPDLQPAPACGLRKEQSSPAVIQRDDGHGGLVKQVVSASGQGCAAACGSAGQAGVPTRGPSIWRTRAVRSKAESYCILHLQSSTNRGVTVQVTFLDAASTPKEIKLLHAPTLASAFRLLPAQLTISAQDARRQLQHSLQLTSHIPVQRFLKVEMAGLALEHGAGGVHAVSRLEVLPSSAIVTASVADAQQLPLPALSVSTRSTQGCALSAESSADAFTRSPVIQPAEDAGVAVAAVSATSAGQAAALAALANALASQPLDFAAEDSTQGPNKQHMPAPCTQQQRPVAASLQPALPQESLTDSQLRAAIQGQPFGPRPQRQQDMLQQRLLDGAAVVEQQRQRLQQLQQELQAQLPRHCQQQQQRHGPKQGAAAALATGGRPSTLLSLLQHSPSWAADDKNSPNSDSSSSCEASLHSISLVPELTDTAASLDTAVFTAAVAAAAPAGTAAAAMEDGVMPQPQQKQHQQQLLPQRHKLRVSRETLSLCRHSGEGLSDSGVLLGSTASSGGAGCGAARANGCSGDAEEVSSAAGAAAAGHAGVQQPQSAAEHLERVGSSSSSCGFEAAVAVATELQEHCTAAGADITSPAAAVSAGAAAAAGCVAVDPADSSSVLMCQVASSAGSSLLDRSQETGSGGLQEPALVDSRTCMPQGLGPRVLQLQAEVTGVLSDRRIQSCPDMAAAAAAGRGSGGSSSVLGQLGAAAAAAGVLGGGRGRTAESPASRQHSSPLQRKAAAKPCFGSVTLSPQVLAKGLLVKHSCPSLAFPRYGQAASATQDDTFEPGDAVTAGATGEPAAAGDAAAGPARACGAAAAAAADQAAATGAEPGVLPCTPITAAEDVGESRTPSRHLDVLRCVLFGQPGAGADDLEARLSTPLMAQRGRNLSSSRGDLVAGAAAATTVADDSQPTGAAAAAAEPAAADTGGTAAAPEQRLDPPMGHNAEDAAEETQPAAGCDPQQQPPPVPDAAAAGSFDAGQQGLLSPIAESPELSRITGHGSAPPAAPDTGCSSTNAAVAQGLGAREGQQTEPQQQERQQQRLPQPQQQQQQGAQWSAAHKAGPLSTGAATGRAAAARVSAKQAQPSLQQHQHSRHLPQQHVKPQQGQEVRPNTHSSSTGRLRPGAGSSAAAAAPAAPAAAAVQQQAAARLRRVSLPGATLTAPQQAPRDRRLSVPLSRTSADAVAAAARPAPRPRGSATGASAGFRSVSSSGVVRTSFVKIGLRPPMSSDPGMQPLQQQQQDQQEVARDDTCRVRSSSSSRSYRELLTNHFGAPVSSRTTISSTLRRSRQQQQLHRRSASRGSAAGAGAAAAGMAGQQLEPSAGPLSGSRPSSADQAAVLLPAVKSAPAVTTLSLADLLDGMSETTAAVDAAGLGVGGSGHAGRASALRCSLPFGVGGAGAVKWSQKWGGVGQMVRQRESSAAALQGQGQQPLQLQRPGLEMLDQLAHWELHLPLDPQLQQHQQPQRALRASMSGVPTLQQHPAGLQESAACVTSPTAQTRVFLPAVLQPQLLTPSSAPHHQAHKPHKAARSTAAGAAAAVGPPLPGASPLQQRTPVCPDTPPELGLSSPMTGSKVGAGVGMELELRLSSLAAALSTQGVALLQQQGAGEAGRGAWQGPRMGDAADPAQPAVERVICYGSASKQGKQQQQTSSSSGSLSAGRPAAAAGAQFDHASPKSELSELSSLGTPGHHGSVGPAVLGYGSPSSFPRGFVAARTITNTLALADAEFSPQSGGKGLTLIAAAAAAAAAVAAAATTADRAASAPAAEAAVDTAAAGGTRAASSSGNTVRADVPEPAVLGTAQAAADPGGSRAAMLQDAGTAAAAPATDECHSPNRPLLTGPGQLPRALDCALVASPAPVYSPGHKGAAVVSSYRLQGVQQSTTTAALQQATAGVDPVTATGSGVGAAAEPGSRLRSSMGGETLVVGVVRHLHGEREQAIAYTQHYHYEAHCIAEVQLTPQRGALSDSLSCGGGSVLSSAAAGEQQQEASSTAAPPASAAPASAAEAVPLAAQAPPAAAAATAGREGAPGSLRSSTGSNTQGGAGSSPSSAGGRKQPAGTVHAHSGKPAKHKSRLGNRTAATSVATGAGVPAADAGPADAPTGGQPAHSLVPSAASVLSGDGSCSAASCVAASSQRGTLWPRARPSTDTEASRCSSASDTASSGSVSDTCLHAAVVGAAPAGAAGAPAARAADRPPGVVMSSHQQQRDAVPAAAAAADEDQADRQRHSRPHSRVYSSGRQQAAEALEAPDSCSAAASDSSSGRQAPQASDAESAASAALPDKSGGRAAAVSAAESEDACSRDVGCREPAVALAAVAAAAATAAEDASRGPDGSSSSASRRSDSQSSSGSPGLAEAVLIGELSLNDLGALPCAGTGGGARSSKDQSSPSKITSPGKSPAAASPKVVLEQQQWVHAHEPQRGELLDEVDLTVSRTGRALHSCSSSVDSSHDSCGEDTHAQQTSYGPAAAGGARSYVPEPLVAASASLLPAAASPGVLQRQQQWRQPPPPLIPPSSPAHMSPGLDARFSPLRAGRPAAGAGRGSVLPGVGALTATPHSCIATAGLGGGSNSAGGAAAGGPGSVISGGGRAASGGGSGAKAAASAGAGSSSGSPAFAEGWGGRAAVAAAGAGSFAAEADASCASAGMSTSSSSHAGTRRPYDAAAAGAASNSTSKGSYNAFSPLHSRLPQSISSRRSSKTQPRTQQGEGPLGPQAGSEQQGGSSICKNLMSQILAAAAAAGEHTGPGLFEQQEDATGFAHVAGGVRAEGSDPDTLCMRDSLRTRATPPAVATDAAAASARAAIAFGELPQHQQSDAGRAAAFVAADAAEGPPLQEASQGSFSSMAAAVAAACAAGGPLDDTGLPSEHPVGSCLQQAELLLQEHSSQLFVLHQTDSRGACAGAQHLAAVPAAAEPTAASAAVSAQSSEELLLHQEASSASSIRFLGSGSTAALAALRSNAATPALIPCDSVQSPDTVTSGDTAAANSPSTPKAYRLPQGLGSLQQQQQEQRSHHGPQRLPGNVASHLLRDSAGCIAVQSLDGVIPDVSTRPTQRQLVPPQQPHQQQQQLWQQPGELEQQQQELWPASSKSAAAAAAGVCGDSILAGTAVSTGVCATSHRLHQLCIPSRGFAQQAPLSPAGQPQVPAAAAGAAAGVAGGPLSAGLLLRGNSAPSDALAAAVAAIVGGTTAAAFPGQRSPGTLLEQGLQQRQQQPFLQQLESTGLQQSQQQPAGLASPLSNNRHRLQHRQQQQAHAAAASAAAASPAALAAGNSQSSCIGDDEGGQLGSSNGARPASASPSLPPQQQLLAPPLTAVASASTIAATAGGAGVGGSGSPSPGVRQGVGGTGGAARMGRLRHRRARSDMPEYYPLSPLESPLHTAMPEDDSLDGYPSLAALASAPALHMEAEGLSSSAFRAAAAPTAAAAGAGAADGRLCAQDSAVSGSTAGVAAEGSLAGVFSSSSLLLGAGGSAVAVTGQHSRAQLDLPLAASPLGSPLRHGLTSPAAQYRLQQQQQLRAAHSSPKPPGAAAQAPAAGGGGVCAAGMGTAMQGATAVARAGGSPELQLEASGSAYFGATQQAAAGAQQQQQAVPRLPLHALQQQQQQQQHICDAVAQAVAVYDGSMSPRRLARIQEFVAGLVSTSRGSSSSGGHPWGAAAPHAAGAAFAGSSCLQGERQQWGPGGSSNSIGAEPSVAELTFRDAAFFGVSGAGLDMQCLQDLLRLQAASSGSERVHHHTADGQQTAWQQQCHEEEGGDTLHHGVPAHDEAEGPIAECSLAEEPSECSTVCAVPAAAASARHSRQHQLLQQQWRQGPGASSGSSNWQQQGDLQRGSADSAQVAVMQSHDALKAPGAAASAAPAVAQQQQQAWMHDQAPHHMPVLQQQWGQFASSSGHVAEGPHSLGQAVIGGRDGGSSSSGAHALGAPGTQQQVPETFKLLAGLAALGLTSGLGSVDSTAASGGLSLAGAGCTAATASSAGLGGSVAGRLQLAQQLAASVEQVMESLDIDGPKLGQELMLNRRLGGPLSAAGPAASARSGATAADAREGCGSLQQALTAARSRGDGQQHLADAACGPLFAGRLAAMASRRHLRRSSVAESPDVVVHSSVMQGGGPLQQPRVRHRASSAGSNGSRASLAGGSGHRAATAAGTGALLSSSSVSLLQHQQQVWRPRSGRQPPQQGSGLEVASSLRASGSLQASGSATASGAFGASAGAAPSLMHSLDQDLGLPTGSPIEGLGALRRSLSQLPTAAAPARGSMHMRLSLS